MTDKLKLTKPGKRAVAMMAKINIHDSKSPVPLSTVAAVLDVSVSYLERMAADLLHSGLIRSVRGPGGGYNLATPSDEISALDIVLSLRDKPNAKDKAADGKLLSSGNLEVQEFWNKSEKIQYILLSTYRWPMF
jgi:Rrf2 family iron-sulfur cluster assembly transcriptional regulator